jgi:hypothetical protein
LIRVIRWKEPSNNQIALKRQTSFAYRVNQVLELHSFGECASLAGHNCAITAASRVEKAFSECENRVVKMNGAIYGRTVSSVPKHRRRRLVMSFEMVRLDRKSA